MRTIVPSPLLKTALLADAGASGLVGMLQVIAAGWLSRLTNFPHGVVIATGLFLLMYAGILVFVARSATVAWVFVAAIIVANLAWAVACMTLLAIDLVTPTGVGVLFIILQVVTVFSFAAIELFGLRASRDGAIDDGSIARA